MSQDRRPGELPVAIRGKCKRPPEKNGKTRKCKERERGGKEERRNRDGGKGDLL